MKHFSLITTSSQATCHCWEDREEAALFAVALSKTASSRCSAQRRPTTSVIRLSCEVLPTLVPNQVNCQRWEQAEDTMAFTVLAIGLPNPSSRRTAASRSRSSNHSMRLLTRTRPILLPSMAPVPDQAEDQPPWQKYSRSWTSLKRSAARGDRRSAGSFCFKDAEIQRCERK